MTIPDPTILGAVTDQHVKQTVDALREMARQHDGQPQNTAAYQLGKKLLDMASPDTLAGALANVLLDQVRTDDATAQLPGLTDEHADLDDVAIVDISGVAIRVIGPETNARTVLAKMAAAGIPAHDTSAPKEATERPDTVLIYTYTDADTRSANRQRRSSTHRRGTGRDPR